MEGIGIDKGTSFDSQLCLYNQDATEVLNLPVSSTEQTAYFMLFFSPSFLFRLST